MLMYLFEHYIINRAKPAVVSENELVSELIRAGFYLDEIYRAFQWLDDLEALKTSAKEQAVKRTSALQPAHSLRLYTPEEQLILNSECRGFLLFLEQSRVLDPLSREMVIDRALALKEPITLGKLKWVTLVVLFHRKGKEKELEWLENEVLNVRGCILH